MNNNENKQKTPLHQLIEKLDSGINEFKTTKDLTYQQQSSALAVMCAIREDAVALLPAEEQSYIDAVNNESEVAARLANTLLGYELLKSNGNAGKQYFDQTFNTPKV